MAPEIRRGARRLPRNVKSMSKEVLQATLKKKKECEARALEVVERLLEEDVTQETFLGSLPLIQECHFQDVVEERAISRLCGYPLCSGRLERSLEQRYRISTRANKVYDLTERKNFCSNLCYKSARFVKDQLLTSPLWLRDADGGEVHAFTLLDAFASSGGPDGDEVDIGTVPCLKDELEKLTVEDGGRGEDVGKLTAEDGGRGEDVGKLTAEDGGRGEDVEKLTAEDGGRGEDVEKLTAEDGGRGEDVEKLTAEDGGGRRVTQLTATRQTGTLEGTHAELETSRHTGTLGDTHVELAITRETGSVEGTHREEPSRTGQDDTTYGGSGSGPTVTRRTGSVEGTHAAEPTGTGGEAKPRSVRRTGSCGGGDPMRSPVARVESSLREWVTPESLRFLRGDGGETLLKDHALESYRSLCRRLHLRELQDRTYDQGVVSSSGERAPLPVKLDNLKVELKVRAFLEGRTCYEAPAEEADVGDGRETNYLPLVDGHSKRALRRRIVLDRLHRVIPGLAHLLQLSSQDVAADVRELVSTFTLEAHNITFKPPEWSLVALVLLKMISVKNAKVRSAFDCEAAKDHAAKILALFGRGEDYLDRLSGEVLTGQIQDLTLDNL